MNFEAFFKQAYGKESDKDFVPYDYQRKLAEEPWPDLPAAPIGMGKTTAAVFTTPYGDNQKEGNMKPPKSIEALILTIRGHKVIIDADLATLYGVPTKALNQAIKRNADRFPDDFIFRLTKEEKLEVVTNCDHLVRLKFAKTLPSAFTEHGAIMAAMVLNSPQAVSMSVFVVRAFIQMREQIAANTAILKRLTEIDRTLLKHDSALREIYQKLLPLLQPPPDPPKRRIGFITDDSE